MPVDAFTGVILGSYQTDPFVPMEPRSWGPSAVNDLHQGGAVMWIGGAAIMFVVIMVTFFQWTRESRSSASMGWLEVARRASLADRFAAAGQHAAGSAGQQPVRPSTRTVDVDADEDQLAAYNAYLARINHEPSGRPAEQPCEEPTSG
jgi:hypothetical protein